MKFIKSILIGTLLSTTATVATANDLNGIYAGLSYGKLKVDLTDFGSGSANGVGVFAGFNANLNDKVLYGTEVEAARYTSGGAGVTNIAIKGRIGYGLGDQFGVFGVLGGNIITDGSDTETDFTYGLAADFAVSSNVLIGLEALLINVSSDTTVTSTRLRAAYKF